jgi:hypothetical protein
MKLKLKCLGWEGSFMGKSLTEDEVNEIMDINEDAESELIDGYVSHDVSDIMWDIDDVIDGSSGDLFEFSKPLDNGTMYFELQDEDDNTLMSFNISDIKHISSITDDYNHPSENAYPSDDHSVYMTLNENKGGLFCYEFESDVEPVVEDFHYSTGEIEAPGGDISFIDSIFFKGEELEVTDYLDNTGKSSSAFVYTIES